MVMGRFVGESVEKMGASGGGSETFKLSARATFGSELDG